MMPLDSSTSVDTRWWAPEYEDSAYVSAFAAYQTLQSLQSSRVQLGCIIEAAYEQMNVFENNGYVGLYNFWQSSNEVNLLTYNALQIAADTLCSKLSQANVQVRYLTDGGNWADRKKAEQLEKLTRGEFYRLKFYELADMARLDMLLFGRGFIKIYTDHETKRPAMERIHPLDIYFDELEARDCAPRQMYQIRLVSKTTLKALYPDWAEEIAASTIQGNRDLYLNRGLNPDDAVEVLEAWYLPSSPGAGDGRHILCIPTATLTEDGKPDEWTRMDFPFATITWRQKRRGPYALSPAQQALLQQRNLDRVVQRRLQCLYTLSAPYVLVDEMSNVNKEDFTSGGVGNIIEGNFSGGMAPQVVTNKVVPQDLLMAEQQYRADIFDTFGATGLESTGAKPAGLDSEPALREYTEQSSMRHFNLLEENQRFVIRAADHLLETVRDIKDQYGNYVAFGHYKDAVEEIAWSEIQLPPDKYVIRAEGANMLSETPAGRKQDVIMLSQAGVLTPKQAIRALQSPDIAAITNDVTSSEQDIEWTIHEMTKETGRYLPPEPHQDLVEGIKQVRNAYLHERRANAPEEVLARLDTWITEADVLLQQQRQAMVQEQIMQQQMMRAATTPPAPPQGAPAEGMIPADVGPMDPTAV